MSERLETKRCIKALYKYSSFLFVANELLSCMKHRTNEFLSFDLTKYDLPVLCWYYVKSVCLYASVVGLKFLVRLCTDMNLKEAHEYANKLKKAEKMQKLREEVHHLLLIWCYMYICTNSTWNQISYMYRHSVHSWHSGVAVKHWTCDQ